MPGNFNTQHLKPRGSPPGTTNNPDGGGPGVTALETCPMCDADLTNDLPAHLRRDCPGVGR